MFERFSDHARQALQHAQREAIGLHHETVGTEHVLLGLVLVTEGRAAGLLSGAGVTGYDQVKDAVLAELLDLGAATEPPPVAPAEALAAIGIDVERIRRSAEETFGPGSLRFPHPRFSLRAKKALQVTVREAAALGQYLLDTEHLLLGILVDGAGVAVAALRRLGVDPAELSEQIRASTAPGRVRAHAASLALSRFAGQLPPLDGADRAGADTVLRQLRLDAAAAYERATRRAGQIDQDLAGELETALATARSALAAAGITVPTPPTDDTGTVTA